VDQRFENDVMQDLSGEGPAASTDEAAFAAMAAAATDGFGEEPLEDDMREDTDAAADLAAEGGFGEDADDDLDLDPGFDAAEDETQDGLEAAIAEALDAQGPEEFFARLLGSVGRLAARPARGARPQKVRGGRRGSGARPASRGVVSVRTGARRSLNGLMQRLGRYLAEGIDEREAVDDLTELFVEEGLDEALPVLGGLAARALLQPLSAGRTGRIGAPLRRQLVASATKAARTLAGRAGPEALRALPRLAESIGRTAGRRDVRPAGLPQALRRTAAQIASQPALLARLIRSGSKRSPTRTGLGHRAPQHLVVPGPVEIHILSR
jgi:hypothetical protein